MDGNNAVTHNIPVSEETIMLFDLEKLISEYERKVFTCIIKRKYNQCEELLTDFCLNLSVLSDKEQLFIARVYFISIITDIIRVQARKDRLHMRILSNAYETISKIEHFKNLAEFMVFIPSFIQRLKDQLIADHLLYVGNIHIEKALHLINNHLQSNYLNVNWLAKQLNISTTHLTNLFKLQFGESVSRYIAKRKIHEIIYELTHTNQSLKRIREKYGFKDHSHFIQFFKKMKGVTPLQYLQAHMD